jgi:hypothetical protein
MFLSSRFRLTFEVRQVELIRDEDSDLHRACETPFLTACLMAASLMTSPLTQLHLSSAETNLQRRHMTTMRCYATEVQQRPSLLREAALRPAATVCSRHRCQHLAANWNRTAATSAFVCHATASDSAEAAEQTAAQQLSVADGSNVAEAPDDTAEDEEEEEEEEEDDDEDWGTDTFVGLGEEELAAQDVAFRQDMLTNDSLAQDGPDHVTGA